VSGGRRRRPHRGGGGGFAHWQVAFFKAGLFGDWAAATALVDGAAPAPGASAGGRPPSAAVNRHTLLMLAAALAARGYSSRLAGLAAHVAETSAHASHAASRQWRRALLESFAACGAAADAVAWGQRFQDESPEDWDEGLVVPIIEAVTRAPSAMPSSERQVRWTVAQPPRALELRNSHAPSVLLVPFSFPQGLYEATKKLLADCGPQYTREAHHAVCIPSRLLFFLLLFMFVDACAV
jgi:hypothetical protein